MTTILKYLTCDFAKAIYILVVAIYAINFIGYVVFNLQ